MKLKHIIFVVLLASCSGFPGGPCSRGYGCETGLVCVHDRVNSICLDIKTLKIVQQTEHDVPIKENK